MTVENMKKTELDILKEKFAELANNCIALHQNLGLIQTAGQSTVLMAECLKRSDKNLQILQGSSEKGGENE